MPTPKAGMRNDETTPTEELGSVPGEKGLNKH